MADALFTSHIRPVRALQAHEANKEAMKGITVTAPSYDLTKASLPSTFAGAHVDQDFLAQIKRYQENRAADAAKAVVNTAAKDKFNRDLLRGNELLQSEIMDIYKIHIDARDYCGEMVEDGTEDDVFLGYLNNVTLSELKNVYKAVTISTAFAYGRSVPAKTTTKGAVVALILSEVKTRHTASN